MQAQLFKISRQANTTADTLAKQAQSSVTLELSLNYNRFSCGSICSLLQALLNVDLNDVKNIYNILLLI